MSRRIYNHITLILILCFTGLNAQVIIGDGVSIQKGTSLIIKNQDVHISTDQIKGEGNLIISHDEEQKITVNKDVKTKLNVQIDAGKSSIQGKFAQKFEAQHLPPFTDEIKIAKKEATTQATQNQLPIRYINTEGLVYDTKEKNKAEPVFNSLPNDVQNGFLVVETMQTNAITLNFDYILPIYSIILNEKRFLDYAELYEFESLTAILKPPIV